MPCSHTFCSLCLRTHLSSAFERNCPSCRVEVSGFDVSFFNRTLDITIDAFLKFRKTHFNAISSLSITESAPVELNDSNQSTSFDKKNKRKLKEIETAQQNNDVDEEDDDDKKNDIPTRRSTRLKPRLNYAEVIDTVVEDNLKNDIVINDSKNQIHLSSNNNILPPIPKGVLACPICNKFIKEELINTHLDNCLKTGNEIVMINHENPIINSSISSSISSSTSISVNSSSGFEYNNINNPNEPSLNWNQIMGANKSQKEPLKKKPAIAYNLWATSRLKKELKLDNLSSNGTRDILIRRHSEWVRRYNSNLDRLTPLSVDKIRTELLKWEDAIQSYISPAPFTLTTDHKVVETDNFRIAKHVEKYKDQFKEMIDELHERKRLKRELQLKNSLNNKNNDDNQNENENENEIDENNENNDSDDNNKIKKDNYDDIDDIEVDSDLYNSIDNIQVNNDNNIENNDNISINHENNKILDESILI